jgi:lipopolysaccharide/colanic/teichoic acid biosynthesis glycosyltransferase
MFDLHGKFTDRMLLPEGAAGFHPISYVSRLYLPPGPAGWRLHIKRAVDLALALTALTVLCVPMLAIWLAIWLDSSGPPLFRQRRIGQHGKSFDLWKFRTMRHESSPPPLRQATRDDPRVTRFGAWLRRTSIDELPQLYNVLLGHMSVVGPRPHAPGTRAGGRLFEDVAAHYAERHRIRPGMTGLAQVRGWRGETDTEQKLLHRLASDLEYIESWSLRLDLTIVLRTIPLVTRTLNAY